MRIKAGGDLPAEQGEGPAVPDPPDADLLPLLGHSGAGGIQKQNHLIHRVLPAVLEGDRHVHGAVWRKQIPAEVAFGDLLPGRIIEIDACNLRILRRRPAVLMRAVKDPAQRRQQRQAEEPCRQRQPLPPPQRDGRRCFSFHLKVCPQNLRERPPIFRRGNRGSHLPLGYRLPAHAQPLRQSLLAHAQAIPAFPNRLAHVHDAPPPAPLLSA